MYSITINGNQTLKTNLNTSNKEFEGTLNDAIVKGNFEKINPYQYHFLMNNKSYNVDVVKLNVEEKSLVVKINSVKFTLQLKDKYDELLHSLGLDNLAVKKVNDVKAPMPGMVLNILVLVLNFVVLVINDNLKHTVKFNFHLRNCFWYQKLEFIINERNFF